MYVSYIYTCLKFHLSFHFVFLQFISENVYIGIRRVYILFPPTFSSFFVDFFCFIRYPDLAGLV
jgi:hypothetical protein